MPSFIEDVSAIVDRIGVTATPVSCWGWRRSRGLR